MDPAAEQWPLQQKNRMGSVQTLPDYIIDRLTVKGDYRVIIGNPSDSTTTGTLQIKGSSSKKNLLEGRSSSSSTNKIESIHPPCMGSKSAH